MQYRHYVAVRLTTFCSPVDVWTGVLAMVRKGHVAAIPTSNMAAETTFIARLFGVAA